MNVLIFGSNSPTGNNLKRFLYSNYRSPNIYSYSRSLGNFLLNKKTKLPKKIIFDEVFIFCSRTPELGGNINDFVNDNFIGLINILKDLDQIEIKRIHYTSSTSIFSASNKHFNKDSFLDFNSYYGLSKFMACKLLKNYSKKSNIEINVLHCPTIIGDGYTKNFMGKLIKKIKNKERIYLYGGKNVYNSICSVEKIFEYYLSRKKRLYNESLIGSSKNLNFRDIFDFLRKNDIKCSLKEIKSKGKPPIINLNNDANNKVGIENAKNLFLNFLERNI